MVTYNYTIEKIESGEKINGACKDYHDKIRNDLNRLSCILRAICQAVDIDEMPEGDITEIKATRCNDGTILVNITGNKDRITAKVRRVGNE